MQKCHRLFFAAIFPAFAALACGRELLVDQTRPDAPYRTLAAAARDAKPGDTIRIAKNTGPYREALYIKQSGAPGAPITVEGEGNVITGAEPLRFRQAENGAWVGAAPIKMPCVITHRGVRLRQDAKTGQFTALATLNDAQDTLTLLPGVPPDGWEISTRYFAVRVQDASHHLYKNIRATGSTNDGFNLHGAGTDLRFENIEAFNNADEGYSAHETIESSIKGGKFWANDNGLGNVGDSVTTVEDADVWDNLGFGVFMRQCVFKARNLRVWGNGRAQVWLYGSARVDLENVAAHTPSFTSAPWRAYFESKTHKLKPPLVITGDVTRLREQNVRVENTPAPAGVSP
ncbi:MAG: right-handed parallel beta-helix repeat-containing protein [Opitutaceae bacterium]|nr:right-handed parallel beta-helix repeat-containing protein [Opitutaceae bacterium]